MPHPGQPGFAVGAGVSPGFQEGILELSTGSVDPGSGVVVGCGLGVTVTEVGGKVCPPMMVVLPPRVLVSTEG